MSIWEEDVSHYSIYLCDCSFGYTFERAVFVDLVSDPKYKIDKNPWLWCIYVNLSRDSVVR